MVTAIVVLRKEIAANFLAALLSLLSKNAEAKFILTRPTAREVADALRRLNISLRRNLLEVRIFHHHLTDFEHTFGTEGAAQFELIVESDKLGLYRELLEEWRDQEEGAN